MSSLSENNNPNAEIGEPAYATARRPLAELSPGLLLAGLGVGSATPARYWAATFL